MNHSFHCSRVATIVAAMAVGSFSTIGEATPILIDFSGTLHPGINAGQPPTALTSLGAAPNDPVNQWNNVNNRFADLVTPKVANLIDTSGANTGISLFVSNTFLNNNNGIGETGGIYPDNAMYDYFYLSAGDSDTAGALLLTGLQPGVLYNFSFFGSRTDNVISGVPNAAGSTRIATYTATGSVVHPSVSLQAVGNTSNTVEINGVLADGLGQITLAMGIDIANSSVDVAYLNVLKITPVPEPASAALLLSTGAMILGLRRRLRVR